MHLGRAIENRQVKGDVTWQSLLSQKKVVKKNWRTPRLKCINLMAENWV